jgi:hypothetical protein
MVHDYGISRAPHFPARCRLSQSPNIGHIGLNNRPVTRRLGIGYVQPLDRGSKKLRLVATCRKTAPFIFIHLQPLFSRFCTRLSLFSSTSGLFFAKQGG